MAVYCDIIVETALQIINIIQPQNTLFFQSRVKFALNNLLIYFKSFLLKKINPKPVAAMITNSE